MIALAPPDEPNDDDDPIVVMLDIGEKRRGEMTAMRKSKLDMNTGDGVLHACRLEGNLYQVMPQFIVDSLVERAKKVEEDYRRRH